MGESRFFTDLVEVEWSIFVHALKLSSNRLGSLPLPLMPYISLIISLLLSGIGNVKLVYLTEVEESGPSCIPFTYSIFATNISIFCVTYMAIEISSTTMALSGLPSL